ncbi:pentatricopeptide repeat-containing protein At1g66345, mitochondrial [Gastrolobium bilobum]|uniref:pentatricopeptide repeat-containing protein At1g66345, mitochondrial n=1 Tax=Gastrolobium bilobum TaxID=150636 RepID=UPI002AB08B5D|nr:pentatricopeptide repeat-containing protein At1g66345, mitochondrial [Gastrolobium bilobum]
MGFSKPLKLLNRVSFPKPQFRNLHCLHTQHHHHYHHDDNIVTAICNSFRKRWNWDTITNKFGSLEFNDSLVEHVLLEFKDPIEAKSALGFFHWSKNRNSNSFQQHGIRSYCIAIHVSVRAMLLTDAKALLQSLLNKNKEKEDRVVVDSLLDTYEVVSGSSSHPLVFDLLIQAYAKMRMTRVAFDTCLYVEERGFSVSLVSYNSLLHVMQKSLKSDDGCDCDMVWNVYEHMIWKRVYPNVVTLRIMVDALCKDGELLRIVDLLEQILGKRSSSSPSVIVNSSLIFRVLESGKMEKVEESEVVVLLKRMLQKNLIPDLVAYSLIVHVKVKLGNLDSAWELYQEMIARGFKANSFVYTSFIGAFFAEGRVEEAEGLMGEMEERRLKPYGETFDHLIVGYANLGRLEECLGVCEKMLSIGFVPSCLSFNKMVERLCERGDVDQANSMLTLLLDKGFLPNDVTYSYLIQGYAKKDEVQEVLKLYYEMEYRSMCPGLSVFTSVIQSLCHCGKLEDAEKYLSIMKGRLLTPSATIYRTLIAGHMRKGNSARALQLENEMASLEL